MAQPSLAPPPMAPSMQPAMVATEAGDEVRWEELDTQDPAARGDTTPDSKRGRRNATQEVFSHQKRRVWLVVVLFGVPFVLIAAAVALIVLLNQAPPPERKLEDDKEGPKRDKLIVKKGVVKSFTFPTVQAALDEARRGETIEIQDAEIAENIFIDGDRIAANVTIQVASARPWSGSPRARTRPIRSSASPSATD